MIKISKQNYGSALSLAVLACITAAPAQDMDVQGDGSNSSIIFQAKNINPSLAQKTALKGVSNPAAGYGTGVVGQGGWMGVNGVATTAGNGGRYGGYFQAFGGIGSNIGVYGTSQAQGSTTATTFGVYGTASYGPTAIGVYGSASGSPTNWGVYSNGNIGYVGQVLNASDVRLKKNVTPLSNSLEGVMNLKPKKYEYRSEEFPKMGLAKGERFGLLAQDVKAVFPNLVTRGFSAHPGQNPAQKESGSSVDSASYLGVDYVSLVPILIGAIQEQQKQIETLNAKIADMRK